MHLLYLSLKGMVSVRAQPKVVVHKTSRTTYERLCSFNLAQVSHGMIKISKISLSLWSRTLLKLTDFRNLRSVARTFLKLVCFCKYQWRENDWKLTNSPLWIKIQKALTYYPLLRKYETYPKVGILVFSP